MPQDTTALDALRDDLMALSPTEVREPRQPVHATLRHGRAMLDFITLDDHAKTLADVGIGKSEVALVTRSLDALEQAQRAWRAIYDRRAFEGDLTTRLEAAYDLRARVLRAVDFNLHDDPQALAVAANVREGEGHSDLIEDLGVLATMLAKHKGAFKRDKTFDVAASIEALEADAKALSEALATFEGRGRAGYDEAIELRDRADTFAHLKLRDLRRAGRYALHDEARARAVFANPRTRKRRPQQAGERPQQAGERPQEE